MNILVSNYTFNKATKQITFTDYLADGIELNRIQAIIDATNNATLYNPTDPKRGGSVSGNVLTLIYDTNTSVFNNTDKLLIKYDDPAASLLASIDNLISGEDEEQNVLVTEPRAIQYIMNDVTLQAITGAGRFYGILVTSHTSGVIKVWDSTADSGDVLWDTINIDASPKNLILPVAIPFATGLRIQKVSGTVKATIYAIPNV